ncbi:hypothetical protein LARI1_G008665 [Lachnellula arida]|uniref:Uncharacterized protein n=1 Tax=Lachnellula arida TaxID=1316785 RepID=A0A8T9B0E6_9HELO|nr:hypothetical protein LARI1_G008665 [Lachnellula arida]
MSITLVLVLGPTRTGGFGSSFSANSSDAKPNLKESPLSLIQRANSDLLETFATKGVELVKGSPTDSTVYQGFEVVVAILGNHAIRNQPAQINTAIAAGEERYYRDKVITRNYLQQKDSEVKGFGYTYVIYGRFTEWAPLPHFGIYPKSGKANIVGSLEILQSLTPAKDAASYLHLQNRSEHLGSWDETIHGLRYLRLWARLKGRHAM